MNSKELSIEASLQAKEIKKLEKWLRMFLSVSSIFLVIAYWGMQGEGTRFVVGVTGVVFTVICILLAAVINLGIKKGRANVRRMLKLAEKENV
ncbi:hypothetical protein [Sebaldella sp. S0638]|uniref:hypothetical protein n=1 Tax=Sebaldella sp. S0638 TaxID=2957809 RepID=UPI00209DB8F4|nr:hypothetical protein [Sebaldella sp. S0638]MCP1223524.1 hypothetical protein [Sebaldella sp. S0638]